MTVTVDYFEAVLSRIEAATGRPAQRRGNSAQCLCPAHEDSVPSLTVSVGDNGAVVLHCHAGCETKDVLKAAGLTFADLSDKPQSTTQRRIVATYDYTDATSALLFQVVRFDTKPKSFRMRRPDGKGGWLWNLNGVVRVLYRLPQVIAAVGRGETIYVVEGEKDADGIHAIGLTATTNPGGAGKWCKKYGEALRGANVVILPDADAPGRKHGLAVACSLAGVARVVKLIELSGLARRGDVTDWLAAGGTADQLRSLADSAPPFSDKQIEKIVRGVFSHSDYGNAERFREQHKDVARFVPQWGWVVWNGKVWERSDGAAVRLAKQTARSILSRAAASDGDTRAALAKWALRSETAQRLQAMLTLAESEPGIESSADIFDADLYLLNCANGILDLRSGELKHHDPAHHLSKIAGAVYDSKATCPIWLNHLTLVFDGQQELIDYFQRVCGYVLTGVNSERVFFVAYGSGHNGKTKTQQALAHVFGQYAMAGSMDSFLSREYGGGIPNDLARLAGARLILAAESKEGRGFNEALLKALTGEDKIVARFLHREFFEFRPTFKLLLAVNHLPRVRETGSAFWERVHVIPFTHYFPPDARDLHLSEKLESEAAGILAWCVSGCSAWIRDEGLWPPDAVKRTTATYRSDSDVLGDFLDERCVVGENYQASARDVYRAYCAWAEQSGERTMAQRSFGIRFGERGFQSRRTTGGQRLWQGVAVKVDAQGSLL